MNLVLYSTPACHLCETAAALLQELLQELRAGNAPGLMPFTVTEIDIVGDDALFERYGVRIPVLAVEGRGGELGWPFDLQMLYEFLTAE